MTVPCNQICKYFSSKLNHKAAKKLMTKFASAECNKIFCPSCISYWEFKMRATHEGPDEVSHYELPHLDIYCLQIQDFHFWLFSSPEHKVLMVSYCDQSKSVVLRLSSIINYLH